MNNLLLPFRVVFPFFFLMAVGVFVRRRKIVDRDTLLKMNSFIFRVCIALLLFINIYQMPVEELLRPEVVRIVLLAVSSVFIACLLSLQLVRAAQLPFNQRSVVIQGIFRGNAILFGLTFFASLCSPEETGIVSLLIAFVTPLYNILAICLFEYYGSKNYSPKKIFFSILKNPLVDACFFAALLLIFHIRLPDILLSPIKSLANIATPLAFVVLGGTLNLSCAKSHMKPLLITCLGKLILTPAIAISAALVLHESRTVLVALLGCMAAPTAVSSFPMAQEMGGDTELAGEIVALTSAASIFTLFVWVWALHSAGVL